MVNKEKVVHGCIIDAEDLTLSTQNHSEEKGSVRRVQRIVIELEENFWQVMHLTGKRIKIVIDKEDLKALER